MSAVRDGPSSEAYEHQHVHQVYDRIASHFSSTRYRPWPVVARFLQSLTPGSVGLDVGCGNGKYFNINEGVFIVGSDRSDNLVRIASGKGSRGDCLVADGLSIPHPNGRFDFAISIAVIHHFATCSRRVAALEAVLGTITSHERGGRALFFVWALEQQNSRRGWGASDRQDVMVPWVMKPNNEDSSEATTYQRYYHLYRKGELEADIEFAGGKVVESGYDKDNWWVVASREPGRHVEGA